eukprot:TRINITY_DN8967_c0_g1_i1.p1 TRINITY_DN8967_c0_g1~~TRINITY_DN8967_c0_g1_i1.p1  ORF type:complete len:363 (+),score=68.25 TRINITY_DN8967_c0_g1_i1:801-1889(+)
MDAHVLVQDSQIDFCSRVVAMRSNIVLHLLEARRRQRQLQARARMGSNNGNYGSRTEPSQGALNPGSNVTWRAAVPHLELCTPSAVRRALSWCPRAQLPEFENLSTREVMELFTAAQVLGFETLAVVAAHHLVTEGTPDGQEEWVLNALSAQLFHSSLGEAMIQDALCVPPAIKSTRVQPSKPHPHQSENKSEFQESALHLGTTRFRQKDRNATGLLSRPEVVELAGEVLNELCHDSGQGLCHNSGLVPELMAQAMEELNQRIDKNHDGLLDAGEFGHWLVRCWDVVEASRTHQPETDTTRKEGLEEELDENQARQEQAAAMDHARVTFNQMDVCLLYTSDAADEEDSVDLGGRRIIKKKNK